MFADGFVPLFHLFGGTAFYHGVALGFLAIEPRGPLLATGVGHLLHLHICYLFLFGAGELVWQCLGTDRAIEVLFLARWICHSDLHDCANGCARGIQLFRYFGSPTRSQLHQRISTFVDQELLFVDRC